MRLSAWRKAAPVKEALTPGVLDVLGPILADLGAEPDPWCHVAWGEEPATRWSLLAPTTNGLIVSHVRVSGPGGGARATAKLVRWPKVQVGELAMETGDGHRFLSVPVEGIVLRGVDDDASRIARFARVAIAAADGQPWPSLEDGPARAPRSKAQSKPPPSR
jgi:hypothetical protein